MSIVSSIRDYVEYLNTLSDSAFTSGKFITETFFYFIKTFQYTIYYIFSFQWLRDFTLLPVTIPKISYAIFSENLFLNTGSEKIFFDFLEIPSLGQNKFLLGFFNSFFLTLPITITHIIAFRRLIIQGIPAAFFSFLGFIIGQTLFILCVTFGFRWVLVPWFSLEPFNYIIGLFLIFQIVYSMVGENLTPLTWDFNRNKKSFLNFFLINLILSWCEQSCLLQYFSNITVSAHPSILEGFSTKTTLANFFSHSNYILGILLGSILFSVFWAFLISQIKNLIITLTGLSVASFIQTINKLTFVVVLGFTLSSIPFYSLDYLLTGPLGFISQDSVFKNTILDSNKVNAPTLYSSDLPNTPLNFETTLFDRGHYLFFPEGLDLYSFEDLNYRGELDWNLRFDKSNQVVDQANQGFFSLSKFFKKEKQSDKQLSNTNTLNSSTSIFYQFEKQNSFLEETENSKDDFSTLNKRLNVFYGFDDSESSDQDFEGLSFQKSFKDLTLASFPSDFLREKPLNEGKLETNIKQKYYENPIYKNLLALDIDLFLTRQPVEYFLTGKQEFDLYQKRTLLNSYYDSLRIYSDLPPTYQESFDDFFDGTKSFTNKVYNQQFKGTWRSIRRLFSLSNPSTELVDKKPILKYDQPLYEAKEKFSPYHEEITQVPFSDQNSKNKFLNDFLSKPLYGGWDEHFRKFVITNKLLPQSFAGYEMTIPQEWSTKFQNQKQILQKQNYSKNKLTNSQKINFSVWPKTAEVFEKDKPEVPFIVLYNSNIDSRLLDTESKTKTYTSLPSTSKYFGNVSKTMGLGINQNINQILAPKRGGFIWPGDLIFDFSKIDFVTKINNTIKSFFTQ